MKQQLFEAETLLFGERAATLMKRAAELTDKAFGDGHSELPVVIASIADYGRWAGVNKGDLIQISAGHRFSHAGKDGKIRREREVEFVATLWHEHAHTYQRSIEKRVPSGRSTHFCPSWAKAISLAMKSEVGEIWTVTEEQLVRLMRDQRSAGDGGRTGTISSFCTRWPHPVLDSDADVYGGQSPLCPTKVSALVEEIHKRYPQEQRCAECGAGPLRRNGQLFCSPRCRARHHRRRAKG